MDMKALISPNEIVDLPDGSKGQRVAQVEPDSQTFPVAEPLYWMDCTDDVVADSWYYDAHEQVIKPIPREEQPLGV